MTSVLLVEASPERARAVSRRAAAQLLARLEAREPGIRVLRRDLARDPPPLVDAGFAEAIRVPAGERSAAERQALAASEALIAELEATDALVIATPMHNFTVPAALKAWIDQVLRIGRSFRSTPEGKRGLLPARPAYVVVASGGYVTGERARQPDFLTPYLDAVLRTLGIGAARFVHVEAARAGWSDDVERRLGAWLDEHLPLPPGEAASAL
jgi:FMN-dependent NADH-azoreductase